MLGSAGWNLLSLWIDKVMLSEKKFGVFPHHVRDRKIPLVRGFDDIFYAPHSDILRFL